MDGSRTNPRLSATAGPGRRPEVGIFHEAHLSFRGRKVRALDDDAAGTVGAPLGHLVLAFAPERCSRECRRRRRSGCVRRGRGAGRPPSSASKRCRSGRGLRPSADAKPAPPRLSARAINNKPRRLLAGVRYRFPSTADRKLAGGRSSARPARDGWRHVWQGGGSRTPLVHQQGRRAELRSRTAGDRTGRATGCGPRRACSPFASPRRRRPDRRSATPRVARLRGLPRARQEAGSNAETTARAFALCRLRGGRRSARRSSSAHRARSRWRQSRPPSSPAQRHRRRLDIPIGTQCGSRWASCRVPSRRDPGAAVEVNGASRAVP
jgi:hypothetical protein